MKLYCKQLLAAGSCLLAGAATAQVLPAEQRNNAWFVQGQQSLQADRGAAATGAKNVILFVGDGMGVSTLTAARIRAGQLQGKPGEEGLLSFEQFPHTALVKTYNVDAQTPDSAGTMTAMMSGLKTDVGVIGVDEDIVRGDCSTVAGNEVATYLELAEIAGMSTGIISTARITHATPAATYAKSADRNWEDVSDMPEEAVSAGCEDIASQLVGLEANLEARYDGVDVDGVDVIMGGGRRHFLPNDPAFNSPDAASGTEGDRNDGRDLTAEWQELYPEGAYVFDSAGFNAVDSSTTSKLFGLFNESHMQYEADRGNDIAGEPSLTEMTSKAIEVLGKNDEGFFLMVESGRIDHAHHAGNAHNALADTIELARAVEATVAATNPEETLILVTADHSHVFTIAGYPKRGNPILGKVVNVGATEPALASDDLPYTTLSYANGLGFHDLHDETDSEVVYGLEPVSGRADISAIDTEAPGYHQEALVPMASGETHAGEDISLHARGPGSPYAAGVVEQNMVFHIMNNARRLVAE
ncbi:alkaline phosphatase [Parahaliea mediterranea]|uniref:alkaline phosphatase n=1 Tax=Parahaliea mediterranea TaxID=651086 RepID=UPI000E2F489A|nr:alkaline phosphatase [Parahaliea mediterranea]